MKYIQLSCGNRCCLYAGVLLDLVPVESHRSSFLTDQHFHQVSISSVSKSRWWIGCSVYYQSPSIYCNCLIPNAQWEGRHEKLPSFKHFFFFPHTSSLSLLVLKFSVIFMMEEQCQSSCLTAFFKKSHEKFLLLLASLLHASSLVPYEFSLVWLLFILLQYLPKGSVWKLLPVSYRYK